MTEIRVRTGAMPGVLTITKVEGEKNTWEATKSGKLPRRFEAVNMEEALTLGMQEAAMMSADPNRKPSQRKGPTAGLKAQVEQLKAELAKSTAKPDKTAKALVT